MNLPSLEIPAKSDELADWLESQLLGEQLRALVAELMAMHPSDGQQDSLQEVIGGSRADLLDNGLGALSREQMLCLLRQPTLLLDLQECVLVEGGSYWQQKLDGGASRGTQVDKHWRLLEQALTPEPLATVAPRSPWYQRPLWVSLATAAAVLIAVFAGQHLMSPAVQPSIPTWGWSGDDSLANEMPSPDYLRRLAGQAREWFNKRPVDQVALAERIAQFRLGCTRLITSEHPALADEDQQWLRERCQMWARDIDTHLASAESASDADSVLQARAAMDATVNRLADAMEARADAL